jgi:hypothetical protein
VVLAEVAWVFRVAYTARRLTAVHTFDERLGRSEDARRGDRTLAVVDERMNDAYLDPDDLAARACVTWYREVTRMLLARLSLAGWCGLLALLGCGRTSQHGGDSGAGRAAGAGGAGSGGDVSAGAATDCDIVEFEDPVVEMAVRQRLGLDPAATLDGELIGQMGGQLDILGGRSLRGLECATSLGAVVMLAGRVDDLSPLRALPKLTSLTFRGTVVAEAALRSSWFPPALRELSFFDLPIVDLTPFRRAAGLLVLAINGGNVTDLTPLAGSSQLESLYLDDNQLEDLTPLGSLTSLRTLSIARTWVSSLEPLAGLSLQQLDISFSGVTSLRGVAAPRSPDQCAHIWAENVPLTDSAWATERDQLCSVGWAVRASRGGDPVICGKWCDTR